MIRVSTAMRRYARERQRCGRYGSAPFWLASTHSPFLPRPARQDQVHTENKYYSSKALIEAEKYPEALQGFLEVVDSGEGKSEWGFKALKQVVKIMILSRSNDISSMIKYYNQFLDYSTLVTRNAAEKKVNSLLDFVSSKDAGNNELLEQFYTSTLQALQSNARNDRLYFKTSVKLAYLYLSSGQEDEAANVVDQLLETTEEGGQLMEVYALQIQLLASRPDRSKHALLQATYRKALSITSAIPHPKVLGIIHQVGGKMHMRASNWRAAATDFFEAFKAFDEAGSPERSHCLKYLVLSNMMMESSVDQFDSQEARAYIGDPVVKAMNAMVSAYNASDMHLFEEAVRHNDIAGDAFIAPYLDELRKKICSKVIVNGIVPFTRIKMEKLRELVGGADIDVDELVISLILDGRISGRINQSNQVLEIHRITKAEVAYQSLADWGRSLEAFI